MADLINLFGRRLRTLRKGRAMTLEKLGHAAGIGYKHIAEIERGVKVPSFEAVERLARALKVEPYELFLPDRLPTGHGERNLKLAFAEIEKHGTPAQKQFLAEVLTAARGLVRGG